MPRSDVNAIRQITNEGIKQYAEQLGLSLSQEEIEDYRELVNGTLEAFGDIVEHPAPTFSHQERSFSDRPSGWRPDADDDPTNAWIRRFRVKGADDGLLTGYDVGLKDNIAFAGYPMTAGSEVLSGFVPTLDATVAQRLLEAGATIVGKQNMESFAFSGSGDTSDFGPVLNPHSDDHLAGGSSGGGAAAVANGDCNISIGSDQAGSIRIPSSCCGIVGIKPTTGLVPYTGAFPLELGIDHLGPMGETVESVALALEAIAGEDTVDGLRLDPRQPRGVTRDDYSSVLGEGISDIDIGVLEEGFDWEFSEPSVDEAVRNAVGVLDAQGATTTSVSMSYHRLLSSAAVVVSTIGGSRTLEDSGVCRGSDGWYWTEFADALDAFTEARADRLSPPVKQALLTAAHVIEIRGTSIYAVAQNIALDAARRYNRLLEDYDALVMPTIVVPPLERDPDLDRVTATSREWTLATNTAAMNLTGHPAITVPCAKVDGLPVGMMLVGAQFDEATLLRIASKFETATDWKQRG